MGLIGMERLRGIAVLHNQSLVSAQVSDAMKMTNSRCHEVLNASSLSFCVVQPNLHKCGAMSCPKTKSTISYLHFLDKIETVKPIGR